MQSKAIQWNRKQLKSIHTQSQKEPENTSSTLRPVALVGNARSNVGSEYPHAHINDQIHMPCKLRNKPITREDIKREEAQRLLADVYCAAVARWKQRLRQKQAFANRALILSGRIPLLHGTGSYHNCSFDRKALHVVLRNELNGDAVAYQFPPSASTAAVYAAARIFLKVPNSISCDYGGTYPG